MYYHVVTEYIFTDLCKRGLDRAQSYRKTYPTPKTRAYRIASLVDPAVVCSLAVTAGGGVPELKFLPGDNITPAGRLITRDRVIKLQLTCRTTSYIGVSLPHSIR